MLGLAYIIILTFCKAADYAAGDEDVEFEPFSEESDAEEDAVVSQHHLRTEVSDGGLTRSDRSTDISPPVREPTDRGAGQQAGTLAFFASCSTY